jgi:sec-independent protein translocase protein TatA
LVIFGPGRLPELGKSLGKSITEFKEATKDLGGSEQPAPPPAAPAAPAEPAQSAPPAAQAAPPAAQVAPGEVKED